MNAELSFEEWQTIRASVEREYPEKSSLEKSNDVRERRNVK